MKLASNLSKLTFVIALLATGISTVPASATSGPGCLYVVNVASWDTLNVRARPSARSRIVDQLAPNNHGIIHLDAKCVPLSRSWGNRWCPISHYSGGPTTKGWVKARYVRDIDCP